MKFFPVLAVMSLLAGGALAQPAPTRLHATIDSVAGDTLNLTTTGGAKISVALTNTTRFGGETPAKLAEIKPDDYIGCGALIQPDGSLQALEVTIFPPELRGIGDGHRPWDQGPQSTMTNGAVGSVGGVKGHSLTIAYKGGEKIVQVPEDAPIVRLKVGGRELLKAGEHVTVFGNKAPDGGVTALNVTVGIDGLVPPT